MKSYLRCMLSVSLVCLMFVLPACNTTKGMGKDMEKAGEGIQKSADKHGAD
ncbi:MAG: entericidin A/B family lipoprotein [Phycisphaerales bacterium]